MQEMGYKQLVCDIFLDWENVKDEILLPDRKSGTGNGTIHVFLGAADHQLQEEFPAYYDAVENGENPALQAVKIKHYFLLSNILSMTGYVGQYYYNQNMDFSSPILSIFSALKKYPDEDGLLSTTSYFKLSTGATRLRPYFKQFDSDGVFTKVIRQILLPNSSYKISLYKNEEGEYAAFWLIGFDWQSDFEADSSKDHFVIPVSEEHNLPQMPLQQIFYGAPGTGKSHEIKEKTKGIKVIRTTFHPDSDYSTFVGAYKPTMGDADIQVVPVVVNNGISLEQNKGTYKEKRITYKFVKQAFLKAYLSAWQSYADNPINPKPQFLIIEEINRGNCAQIFGDLFQLLDRADNGFSEYPIEADADVQQAVENAFAYEDEYKLSTTLDIEGKVVDYVSNYDSTLSEDVGEGRVLLLPPNLYIWATMNTSDQSLFPIDSAFKRRWDWVYIPIKPHDEENYRIEIGTSIYNWWGFLEKINQVIDDTTSSEDKKLGYFFVRAEDKVVKAEKFVSKVLFYLWNDVFKNYGFDNPIFSKGNNQKLAFSDFFEKDGSPNTIMVNAFLNKLDETIDNDHSFVETQLSEDNNSEQADSEA